MTPSITVLGARGSIPVSGSAFARYGGATTCILVRLGEQPLIIDAGSGLLSLPEDVLRLPRLSLLLTHPHLDHLLGLPLCRYAFREDAQLDIYAVSRAGLDARSQICRMLSPPLWPIGPDRLAAQLSFHELPPSLTLDGLRIDVLEGVHPGGVSVFRIEGGGRRVVCATDCTVEGPISAKLAAFARDCDLLLCDGQYSDAEWKARALFGHSTWSAAARLARDCGAKRLRVIHHDPFQTDAELDAAGTGLRQYGTDYSFAKEGEVIEL